MADLATWLEARGLGHYADLFRAHAIGLDVLPELTDADLRELGLPLGDRKRLLRAVAQPEPQAPPAAREAERRQLTVMFVDLVGSTALSTRLDPEEMRDVMHRYQSAVTAEIARFEGHVAKLMGDGVLAYFGWPTAHEDAAERAARAGLAVVIAVGRQAVPGQGSLAARVGIATGTVVVGDLVGEGAAQEEAVIGETPNLAARLQQLAEPGSVVVAHGTRQLLGRLFELEDLGPQTLKGLAQPAHAFLILRETAVEGRFEALHGERVTPLVGRDHELGLLLDRFARACEGEGQVVLLSGEPGIGKSRIVRALRRRLAADAFTPLTHHCSPYHANTPLWPVAGLLERAAGIVAGDTPEQKIAKLETMAAPHAVDPREAVALLAPLLGVEPGGPLPELDLPSDRRRQRTLEVLLELFEGLAAQRPVLCVYEDAHWMDPSTLELVSMVVERVQHLRALIVVTFRPEFTPPWSGHAHVTHLSLSRLTRRHAAAMIEHLAGGKRLPDEVLASISERTDGVPLFVEELTKTVLESGVLRDRDDRFELTGPLPSLAIPATLQDSLMARLDRSAAAKEVAQLAAVIGREFSYDLLAAAATIEAARLPEALDQLVAAELVFRRGSTAYAFKHALVQDAAYRSLLKQRRQDLHGRIAECLERRFPEVAGAQPELMARHLSEAGLAERAIEAWLTAGLRAIDRSAHHEAISHLRRALDLLGGLPASTERAERELQVQLALGGRALLATKGFADAEVAAACGRAEELARQLGDDRQLAWALRGLCYVHHVRGRLDRSYGLKQALLELADRLDDPMFTADARNAVAFSEYHLGLYREAHANLEAGRAVIERHGLAVRTASFGVNVAVFNAAYRSHTEWQLGRADTARRVADEAIDLAGRLAQPFGTVVALDYAAMLHQFRREPAETRDRAEAALAVCNERGFAYYRAWAAILLGRAAAEQGRPDDGIEAMQGGLRDLRATGAELRVPYYLGLLADACGQAGRIDEAEAALTEAFEIAARNGEAWTEPELHLIRARLAGADRPDRAEASLRQAIETAEGQGAVSLGLRARLRLALRLRGQGRPVEAVEALAPSYAAFTEGFDTPDLVDARRLLDELA